MLSQEKEITKKFFEKFRLLNGIQFKKWLAENDPNVKLNGIPLLHFVVRGAGPIHLQALIEAQVDVNSLDTLKQASALQWITGMIFPKELDFESLKNYDSFRHKDLKFVSIDGVKLADGFAGSANEIMLEISNILLFNGAKLDFYSACALGIQDTVKKHLQGNSKLAFILGPDGSSPLAWAARRGQNDIISLLLEYGADVNQLNKTKTSMPLEEAILFHGTKETVALLIKKGANIRKNIIGICCDKADMVDLLLNTVNDPEELITVDDIKKIQSTTYYENILQVFIKNNISLSKIDKERPLSDRPLIFDGCTNSSNILRLLISMGCNVNAVFPAECVILGKNNENAELINAKPLFFLYFNLHHKDAKKSKLQNLKKMAILFLHGSDIHPTDENQPHPLNDLHDIDLVNFLSFLYAEIKSIQKTAVYAPFKLNGSSKALLTEKINKAYSDSTDQSFKNKLEKLSQFCKTIPSLKQLCFHNIIKSGLFKNTKRLNIPEELKESIECFTRLNQRG